MKTRKKTSDIWENTALKTRITKSIDAMGINLSDVGLTHIIYNGKHTTIQFVCGELTEYGERIRLGSTEWFIYPKNMRDFIPQSFLEYERKVGEIVFIKFLTQRLMHLLIINGLMYRISWGENLGYFIPTNNIYLAREAITNGNITRI